MSLFIRALLCGVLLYALPGRAAPPAVVEQVQAPAWLVRGMQTSPLRAGQALTSGDRIRTGDAARVYLLLAEGSRVKIGQDAQLALYSQSVAPEKWYKGALDVALGAFRFTTGAVDRFKARRDVTIRVATATIGIRGTDVWGRAAGEGDVVALIEGHISLSRQGEELSIAPMQWLDAPRQGGASIRTLDVALLARLAGETEIVAGAPASQATGAVRVRVAQAADEGSALALYDQIGAAGFAAHIVPQPLPVNVGEQKAWRYDLELRGYADASAAAAAAARLAALLAAPAQTAAHP